MILLLYVLLILILACVLGYYAIIYYNLFKKHQNRIQGNFAQIKVALKKRLDMILQLLGAVEGYATFEKETQTKVIKLRSAVSRANNAQMNSIDTMSSTLLGRLFAVAENYPDLKSEQVVQKLLAAITDIEKEIAEKRYLYNDHIMEYNTLCDLLPTTVYARIFGFRHLSYLDFAGEEEKRPDITIK